jgi:hypothetical protein
MGFSASDTVDPPATVDLLRGDGEPKPLLQRAAEGAADGVRLPAGRRDDLLDRHPFWALQHDDQLRLLRPLAGLARLWLCARRWRLLHRCRT